MNQLACLTCLIWNPPRYPLEAQLEKLHGVRRAAVVSCKSLPSGVAVVELETDVTQRQCAVQITFDDIP